MVINFTLAQARQDVRDALAANFTQESFEGSVPSAATLRRINGVVYPYIVYRFPDIMPTVDTSLAGPQGDSYVQFVSFILVAPDAATVEALYMKILSVFIGFQPSYSGLMTKRGGSGTYPIGVDDAASEAFVGSANFTFTTMAMPIPQP